MSGPGCRIQYSTVLYSTAQHMIYHTISRKQNKGVMAGRSSQAKQLKSKGPGGANASADRPGGME